MSMNVRYLIFVNNSFIAWKVELVFSRKQDIVWDMVMILPARNQVFRYVW